MSSLNFFDTMALNIRFRVEPVTPHAKGNHLTSSLSMRTSGLSASESGHKTWEVVCKWCEINLEYAVVIGSPSARPQMDELLQRARKRLLWVCFQERDAFFMHAALVNDTQALQGPFDAAVAKR